MRCRPCGFDDVQRYPVIDPPYLGRQTHRVAASSDPGCHGCVAEAVSAAGFAVPVDDSTRAAARHQTERVVRMAARLRAA
ncbi:hypothetical protein OG948_39435 (plasmid) [Embleya sp. NBC_00888]|uniref:hypothetical protein n=1 Tax=Embleya sp. NBC_00888 TaxID=2975960 RepID=UPI002F90BFA7|nr:hypothetical protein OG948_39435 [Embleya sp. NBC_00888]